MATIWEYSNTTHLSFYINFDVIFKFDQNSCAFMVSGKSCQLFVIGPGSFVIGQSNGNEKMLIRDNLFIE
jgi:hypothetical protein